jgi:hypothetical protein
VTEPVTGQSAALELEYLTAFWQCGGARWCRCATEIEELTQRYGRQRGARRHTTHDPGCRAKGVVVATSLRCGRGLPSWYNSNSFIVERLTGEYILDHHTALPYFAGERTPIFDPRTRSDCWTYPAPSSATSDSGHLRDPLPRLL